MNSRLVVQFNVLCNYFWLPETACLLLLYGFAWANDRLLVVLALADYASAPWWFESDLSACSTSSSTSTSSRCVIIPCTLADEWVCVCMFMCESSKRWSNACLGQHARFRSVMLWSRNARRWSSFGQMTMGVQLSFYNIYISFMHKGTTPTLRKVMHHRKYDLILIFNPTMD